MHNSNRENRPLELEEFNDWRDSYATQQFFQFLREFKQQVIDEMTGAIEAGEQIPPEKQSFIHGSFAVIDDVLNIEHADLLDDIDEEGEDENATH